ncbi:MAG: hypothetical protein ABI880_13505 [Acidobacteriota bacterium]
MTPLASRSLAALGAALLIVAFPAAAPAQGLADVARAEQARRKEQPKGSKIYTNDNVKTDITPSTPTTAAAPSTASTADAASPAAPAATTDADATATGGERKDPAYWKGRMTAARESVERSKTFAEALQTRINSLTADVISRDDPAQQRLIGENRTKAVAELDRVQREIATQNKAIAAIEDEARKAGVPPGWLR